MTISQSAMEDPYAMSATEIANQHQLNQMIAHLTTKKSNAKKLGLDGIPTSITAGRVINDLPKSLEFLFVQNLGISKS